MNVFATVFSMTYEEMLSPFSFLIYKQTNKQKQNKTVENPKLSLLSIKRQIPSYNTRMQIFLLWTSLQGDDKQTFRFAFPSLHREAKI